MHFIVSEVSFIFAAVVPCENAFSLSHVVSPVAFIGRLVNISHSAFANASILVEISSVYSAGRPLESSLAVASVRFPLTIIRKGQTGTISEIDEYLWIRLDKEMDVLAEWDNCVQTGYDERKLEDYVKRLEGEK